MTNNFDIKGLTDTEVNESRTKFGSNKLEIKKENGFIEAIKGLIKEPMVILLLVASTIYFVSGKIDDGIFLSIAIIIVASISLFQDSRSRNALEKLKNLTQPNCKVIRNGNTVSIKSDDLVIGDSLVIEEGTAITADGTIIHSNDFSVNESILTGESFAVSKNKQSNNNQVYQGTTVASGLAIATVTAIGNQTKLGQIGESLQAIKEEKTPLEIQVNNFVKNMVIIGAVVFLIVWGLNFYQSRLILDSLLKSLTLAMSILPEEIPVAFATFMALGSWRLMKMGIVVKQMKTVETLGSATVICTDKTGTITENKMSLAKVYAWESKKIVAPQNYSDPEKNLIEMAMWASEPIPFDPMEIALHDAYSKLSESDKRPDFSLVHEYPLGGKPPMMTHIFENKNNQKIIAAKGAPEALLAISNLSQSDRKEIENAIATITSEGYRVLGVGEAVFADHNYPKTQQEFQFKFKGIVAFYDPPKENISQVLRHFYNAGIAVKIITGDNAATTQSIAKQINFAGFEKAISGDELMKLSENELKTTVAKTNIFTRMFPEAKLKIIEALKSNGEIVAMTGDGVNDGPALKAAHIGIAMGKKGTEIAKQAASLILIDDDLSKMVDAVAMGRRIYTNLKKAFRYIISIHIPIILTVFIPLALGWIYPTIFSPIHIIFLELIMGPTCSIIFENEPIEKNSMLEKPRPFSTTIFNRKELGMSILQGLFITAGTLFGYQYSIQNGFDEKHTRTVVFVILITANVFLTLVNRSFYYSIFKTIQYKNNLVFMIIGVTIAITSLLLYVPFLNNFFEFEFIRLSQLIFAVVVGFISVIWIEIIKIFTRMRKDNRIIML